MKRKDKYGRALRTGESQRKDGSYNYRKVSHGKTIVNFYASTLEGLRAKEDSLKYDAMRGVDIATSNSFTVNDAYYKYMENRTDLRQATKESRRNLFKNHIRDDIGRRKLKSVKYSEVVAYYIELMTVEGLSAGTIDNLQSILSYIFKAAMRDSIIVNDPITGANTEAKRKADKQPTKRHALTEKEQAVFIDFVRDDLRYSDWWPMVAFMFGTGCRAGELGALTWQDIDMSREEIHISKTLGDSSEIGLYINPTKTANGARTIPMIDSVKEALNMQRKWQFAQGGCKAEIDGYRGFVFMNEAGKPMTVRRINSVLKRAQRDCNRLEAENAEKERREPFVIQPFTAHCIRHTFASRLCASTTDLKFIQSVMGHADIAITLNIYAEVSDDRKHNVMNDLDAKVQFV